ncbi:MAG: Gfo/Idh/MocA family oxidoreductase [Lentisphaeria bacterium]|nr:Gfo/Idh/MocA family oxidoreductase [Lentisphaeria bacterium]
MSVLNIVLWGDAGHQISWILGDYPQLNLIGYGNFKNPATIKDHYPDAIFFESFEEVLANPNVEMISLCSALREEQVEQSIHALAKGIHVYAEKPCAFKESDLDRIIEASKNSTANFHEMSGTLFEQPLWSMHELVKSGVLGDIVQVYAQKSYPYGDWRPKSEVIDGGLTMQCGVHALRFIEHVAGVEVNTIQAVETMKGETREGSDLRMASSMMGTLTNGGVFSVVSNYLKPQSFETWGYEELRIFGTKGMLEATEGFTKTKLVTHEKDFGEIDVSSKAPDWLQEVINHNLSNIEPYHNLEVELHPTRMVIQAKSQLSD